MANVFNSVKGLHPKFNSFSAHTYRNDFTSQLGINLPVYIQHVVPNTRVKLSTSALIRLQALIAPIMDNIDFYVHFWKIPYRLIENDRFTQFISGEIEAEDYEGIFATPYDFAEAIWLAIGSDPYSHDTPAERIAVYEKIVGNGSLLDMLGYDRGLFQTYTYNSEGDTYVITGGQKTKKFNYRSLIGYYMLHENWYMNENVPYFSNWQSLLDYIKNNPSSSGLQSLALLLEKTYVEFGTTFLPHGWEKDYFTSALPNVQFGEPVSLPLGGTAAVTIPRSDITVELASLLPPDSDTYTEWANNNQVFTKHTGGSDYLAGTAYNPDESETISKYLTGFHGHLSSLEGTADLSEATAITINELRFANALQVFKERQLRFGRRRQEYYKGFFDVTPEDLRLQIPKYLGGGRIPINIADIEQTSQTSGTQALGHLAGKGTAVAGGFAGFTTFCSEESVIIGIAFAMPHITYCQHVSKFLMKTNDIYDYFNPSFEHLGEQAIEKIEIYSSASNPSQEFGYTPRYNEYRFHLNEMHGEFKNTLSYWTLGRIFSSQPALNQDFVYMQPNVFDRIFAVSGQPSMLASILFRVRIVQPVSKYGTPMLLA